MQGPLLRVRGALLFRLLAVHVFARFVGTLCKTIISTVHRVRGISEVDGA